MKNAKRIAFCGVMTALCVVILTLGALSGVGNYAASMLAGLCLLPAGWEWGRKTELILWIAVSLVGAIVIPDPETILLFAAFFGWYPVFRDFLVRFSLPLRLLLKLLVFNLAAVGCEILVMKVLAPEAEEPWVLIVLLLLGNAAFLIYDAALPKIALLYRIRLRKILIEGKRPHS